VTQLENQIDSLTPASEKVKPRVLVSSAPVERKTFERFISIQSSVVADEIVSASSETGGRIIQLNVEEGNYVKRGQLVAKLDMESVDKQIAELETSLSLAVDIYERQKRLWDQNIGSEIQYLQAKNNKERIEKSLETVKFQLTKANVYAPISGVVDMVFLKPGEMTAPGTPIVQILSTGIVKVVADVPEKYLRNIKKGETVTVSFPALDMETKAKVSEIGRTINPGNRTFKVEVSVPNNNGVLKPNLLASMLLNDFTEKDVVVIPIELVQQEVSGRSYVFIKGENEDGAYAKKVMVETGESYEGNIIITSGLEGGEEIIVNGARGLANNELIKIIEPTSEANNG
jgi:RND family efflux transporter MFP subunit